jgi:two-component system chemotaxis response regulator CheB
VKLVTVGASFGGLYALMELLGSMTTDFACPIAVAQHRAPGSEAAERLGEVLSRYSALPVRDVEHGEEIGAPGVYLAPPDYHLMVEQGRFELSVDDVVEHSRPSIDVLFESAARAYGPELVGVLLTGFGKDGTAGMAAIQTAGGLTIAEDPEFAAEASMPRNAIRAGAVTEVLPLDSIAPRLLQACRVPA